MSFQVFEKKCWLGMTHSVDRVGQFPAQSKRSFEDFTLRHCLWQMIDIPAMELYLMHR